MILWKAGMFEAPIEALVKISLLYKNPLFFLCPVNRANILRPLIAETMPLGAEKVHRPRYRVYPRQGVISCIEWIVSCTEAVQVDRLLWNTECFFNVPIFGYLQLFLCLSGISAVNLCILEFSKHFLTILWEAIKMVDRYCFIVWVYFHFALHPLVPFERYWLVLKLTLRVDAQLPGYYGNFSLPNAPQHSANSLSIVL